MAQRRDAPRHWWGNGHEDTLTLDSSAWWTTGEFDAVPFHAAERLALVQMGLARPPIARLTLDVAGLEAYQPVYGCAPPPEPVAAAQLVRWSAPRHIPAAPGSSACTAWGFSSVEPGGLRITLDVTPTVAGAEFLASQEPTGSYHDNALPPVAALWLYAQRALVGRPSVLSYLAKGPLTRSAWCTHCGAHFDSGRVNHWQPGRPDVQRHCPDHVNVRPRPPLRECAAPDCDAHFAPARANQIFHAARCKSADHTARRDTLGTPQGHIPWSPNDHPEPG